MDITEQLEKLKALREKGALTENEYCHQKRLLLDQLSQNNVIAIQQPVKEKEYVVINNQSNILSKVIAYAIMIVFVGYFGVPILFRHSIQCNESISETHCECVKTVMSEKVTFSEKLRILLEGASAEELAIYTGIDTQLACAFIGAMANKKNN